MKTVEIRNPKSEIRNKPEIRNPKAVAAIIPHCCITDYALRLTDHASRITHHALGYFGFGISLYFAALAAAFAGTPDFKSPFIAVGFSRSGPAFECFSVDSLGQGKVEFDPVLLPPMTNQAPVQFERKSARQFAYRIDVPGGKPAVPWSIEAGEKTLVLRSEFRPGIVLPPLVLMFNQKSNHATLLGRMQPGDRRMSLPCVLHLPDMGSVRVTSPQPGRKLEYDARRWKVKQPFVRIEFPPATAEQPRVEYRLEVAAIHPRLPGIERDARFDGFRRSFLNIFQVNPRVQMLANNAASDPVPFTIYTYSDVALAAPPLAKGLTCFDLVRMTLDRYLAGAKGYGQIGYACTPTDADLIPWQTPWTALDTYPSLLIAACNYVQGANDLPWARANYGKLAAWAREMMAADKNGNGLIEYPGSGNLGDRPQVNRRPANWWDTINFGHEDAYANALAYRACQLFSDLARKLDHAEDARLFTEKAARLRGAYVPTFRNPATGVLAGWKSADGQLHDYWFTFVNGLAITCGLVDDKEANDIMDRLLRKMDAVGYTNFAIGLPGNLVPVRKGDYVQQGLPPTRIGEPARDDGADGFQYYENGGATGCHAYFTVKALYQLGRRDDARRIFLPMLAGYAAGNFQGFCADGMSKDWRDWQGGCHGYEGLLVDNYLTLLAVFDELAARK